MFLFALFGLVFLLGGQKTGGLTLHAVLHVLGKKSPHDLCRHLAHVQLLGEPEEVGRRRTLEQKRGAANRLKVGGAGSSLVEDGCVGIAVLLNDRYNQHDEFGPEVQVLDTRALFLQWNLLLVLGGVGSRGQKSGQAPPPDLTHPEVVRLTVSAGWYCRL